VIGAPVQPHYVIESLRDLVPEKIPHEEVDGSRGHESGPR